MKTREELFADWLSAHVSPGRLSECYMAIPVVETFAQEKKIINGSLYDIIDPEISVKIINAISSDRVFRYQQKNKIRNIFDVAQQFHRYVKEISKSPQLFQEYSVESSSQQDNSSDSVDYAYFSATVPSVESSRGRTEGIVFADGPVSETVDSNATTRDSDDATDENASVKSNIVTDDCDSADTGKEKDHTSDNNTAKKTSSPETEWDIFDTALMIEACLQAKEGRVTRFNAACELSTLFREKAIRDGYVIDDKYRNENMILWQLISLGQLLNGLPDVKNPSTEVFVEMVELYSADKERFYEILQEAKGQKPMKKTKKELFLKWLSERTSSGDLPKYEAAIPEVEAFAQKNGVFVGSVYDVSDPIIFRQLVRALVSDEEFCVSNKDLFRQYLDVAMKFYSFLCDNESDQSEGNDDKQAEPEKQLSPEETVAEDDSEQSLVSEEDNAEQLPSVASPVVLQKTETSVELAETEEMQAEQESSNDSDVHVIDFSLNGNYQFTKPISGDYFGDSFPVDSWKQLYVKICKLLYVDYPHEFIQLRNRGKMRVPSALIFDTVTSKGLYAPVEIHDGFFVETKRSAADLLRNIRRLLDACRVDYENLVIRYIKIANETEASSIQQSQENRSEKSATAEILRKEEEQAPQTKAPVDSKIAFSQWMRAQGIAAASVRTGLWALSRLNDFAVKAGFVSGSIYKVTSPAALNRIWNMLIHNTPFVEFKKNNSVVTFAFNKYLEFREGDQKAEQEVASPVEEKKAQDSGDVIKRRRSEFVKWLVSQGLSQATCNSLASAIASVDSFSVQHGLSDKSFYSITDIVEAQEKWNKLQSSEVFIAYNRGQNRRFSTAIYRYLTFCKNQTVRGQPHDSSVPAKMDYVPRVGGHPGKAEFDKWLHKTGAPAGSIKSYTDGLAVMGKFLLENGLEDRHIFSIRGIARLERIYSVIQKNDAYRQMRTSATASLDLFALKKYISFRKNNTSDELDEKTAERFSRVLAENFENGFRVRSVIDRNRFKQFYSDRYGEVPHQNDDDLVETIKKIGELQDDRVFFREKGASGDLLDDIQADIAKAFRQGATCVYISCVYEKYREALAAQLQIYNEELLCEQLLATCYGDYRQIRQYFCLSSRAADVVADVNAIMKQSQNPMTYSQIHDVLWYIPVDQIRHTLVSSDGMVNVAPETYFYAYNLPVSAVELEHIAELLHAKLAQKSFITDAELRDLINVNCPSVAINTEAFSTMGLRKALSVLLRNRFNFNGSRISERGKSLNVWQEIESFCDSHDRFSLEELQEFAKELQSQINWEAVFSKSIRLSQTEFVRKDLVPFDVRATDEALDRLVGGDYVALKDFTLFLQLPVLSVKWNAFVLEGYVSQFSREFTLLHTGYSVNECCGAIVRRSSAIKDFKSLLTDVLAHSPSWKTQDDALQLLARKGYLLQRRFTEIDAVVTQARIARDSEKDDADV